MLPAHTVLSRICLNTPTLTFAHICGRLFKGLVSAVLLATPSAYAQPEAVPTPGFGPTPQLPLPQHSVIPTVNIAPAKGWPPGMSPKVAEGLKVVAFARDLDHPRWIYVLPNGDVLVAESNAPPKADGGGIIAMITGFFQKWAGARTVSANRITLLRDTDGDGVADVRTVFAEGLNSPFGMALVGDTFYVANTDSIIKFAYAEGAITLAIPATKLVDLPAGTINHHWTKNVIANADGSKLFVTVGSNSNIGERGEAEEVGRASIWEIETRTGRHRIFASGLRNPNGMAWLPSSNVLWTVVNERDELGNDLVPDYLTSVRDGGFYGWPYSYFGQNVDIRMKPARPDLVASAISPDYGLGAHTASLGLAWSQGAALSPKYSEGMFIGQHGSWNRRPHSGYKVVFVPFEKGQPNGLPSDVLSGFLSEEGSAHGRPVGVAMDKSGGLLVADDVGNVIWRVSGAK